MKEMQKANVQVFAALEPEALAPDGGDRAEGADEGVDEEIVAAVSTRAASSLASSVSTSTKASRRHSKTILFGCLRFLL